MNQDDSDSDDQAVLMDATQDVMEVFPDDLGPVDIQGFHFNAFEVTRATYRQDRNQHTRQFQASLRPSSSLLEQLYSECVPVKEEALVRYRFGYSSRREPTSLFHFQLRHLLASPRPKAILYPYLSTVRCWCPSLRRSHVVLDFHHPEHTALRGTKICTLTCSSTHLFIGGIHGDMIVKDLAQGPDKPPERIKLSNVEPAENGSNLINHLTVLPQCETHLLAACNDKHLRRVDAASCQIIQALPFDYAINCSAVSFDDKIACVCGDHPDPILMDLSSNQEINKLKGHIDYAFSAAFRSDDVLLATASEDGTVRVYDMRKNQATLALLKTEVTQPRVVQFSPDRRTLAVAEAEDYVHLYDTDDFGSRQSIDFFGDVTGITFERGSEHLYIGLAGYDTAGLLYFTPKRDTDQLYAIQ